MHLHSNCNCNVLAGTPKPEAEDDTIADLGKPKLGEITTVVVTIVESKEFHVRPLFLSYLTTFLHLQNLVDVMLKSAKTGIVLSTSSWKEQFIEALSVSAGKRAQCT